MARFLCDGMLGHLARALRVLGFDAVYAGSDLSDGEVLEAARREGRILLTRDVELARRALARESGTLLLQELPVDEQLVLVISHLGLRLDESQFFTRCTVCNGVLEKLLAGQVPADVPASVRRRHTEFWRCPDCRKVYWAGTHVEAMEGRIQSVLKALTGPGA